MNYISSRSEECKESMKALEMACNDTLLPIEIEAVKNFLGKIHDLRKVMLETLMGALQEGKILLDRLKEISNEGTLDSRPDRIKLDADHGIVIQILCITPSETVQKKPINRNLIQNSMSKYAKIIYLLPLNFGTSFSKTVNDTKSNHTRIFQFLIKLPVFNEVVLNFEKGKIERAVLKMFFACD